MSYRSFGNCNCGLLPYYLPASQQHYNNQRSNQSSCRVHRPDCPQNRNHNANQVHHSPACQQNRVHTVECQRNGCSGVCYSYSHLPQKMSCPNMQPTLMSSRQNGQNPTRNTPSVSHLSTPQRTSNIPINTRPTQNIVISASSMRPPQKRTVSTNTNPLKCVPSSTSISPSTNSNASPSRRTQRSSSSSSSNSTQSHHTPRPPPRSKRPTLQNLNPVFHRRDEAEDADELKQDVLKKARKMGILNLSCRGLSTVPAKVYEINEADKDIEVQLEQLSIKDEDAWWNQEPLSNLDLSSNTLTCLSPKIKNLYSLTTLLLHDNCLVAIPKEIGKLEKLTRVNLSRNKLNGLPVEFFTLPDLRYLNLSYNNFDELHPDISDLHMLEFLDVSHNNLTSLPCGIGFLVRVTELLLSNNHIKELPPDLVNMRSLQKLELSHNDLIHLPEDMGSLRKLQCLYLQHNDIRSLPTFEDCGELQELHVANNYLAKLPADLCANLPHLKILDIRDNNLSNLPNEIALLRNLIRLDISNNSISELPCSLGALPHLVSLQVEGNPIKTIRRDILQRGTARVLKTLRDRSKYGDTNSIDGSNSNSTTTVISNGSRMVGDGLNSPRGGSFNEEPHSIYPNKYQMRQTRSLCVTMQALDNIPEEVFEVASQENVSIVDFSKNCLETLPKGLSKMSRVQELVLQNNWLTSIPPFISQFTNIALVNLACNRLTELPNEFGYLNTLRELNISNNKFQEIPRCVYELKNLEVLLAGDNRITSFDATPGGLGALKRLARLDLRNNSIEHVPPILGNLRNITNLEIMGNPFRQPRHQIITKGTESIMAYLRGRIPN